MQHNKFKNLYLNTSFVVITCYSSLMCLFSSCMSNTYYCKHYNHRIFSFLFSWEPVIFKLGQKKTFFVDLAKKASTWNWKSFPVWCTVRVLLKYDNILLGHNKITICVICSHPPPPPPSSPRCIKLSTSIQRVNI